jgi:hypothetical protein
MTSGRCLAGMCISLLVSTVLAGSLPIEPSRISLGTPKDGSITGLAITARNHPGHIHVTVWMELSTRSKTPVEVTVPLGVSRAISVTGLVLGTEVGSVEDAGVARNRYENTVRAIRDPALLEQKGDRLALRVFPLTRETTSTVKIELALPYGAPLVIATGNRSVKASLDVDGLVRTLPLGRPIALGEALEENVDEGPSLARVDAETSLLSLPGQYVRPPVVASLRSFHDHIPEMPTVALSERVVPSPFKRDEPHPIKREIVMYASSEP